MRYRILYVITLLTIIVNSYSQSSKDILIREVQSQLINSELSIINEYLRTQNVNILSDIAYKVVKQSDKVSYYEDATLVSTQTKLLIELIDQAQEIIVSSYEKTNTNILEINANQNKEILEEALFSTNIVHSLKSNIQDYQVEILKYIFNPLSSVSKEIKRNLNTDDASNGVEVTSWENKYFNLEYRFTDVLCNLELIKSRIYMSEYEILSDILINNLD